MINRFTQGVLVVALGLIIAACDSKPHDDVKPADTTAKSDTGTVSEAPKTGVQLGSSEGRFNILFPPGFTNPNESTREVETPAGKLPMTLYTSAQDTSSAYMVAYIDYPENAFQAGIEKMLDGAREGALKNMNATLENQESVTLNGHPGRSMTFSGTSEGRSVYGRIDYYIAKPRLYQVLFLTSNQAQVTAPEIVESFRSFAITADSSSAASSADTAK